MKKCIVAGILVFNRDGKKVLLVKHKKLGVWIYPGGHIEENENPLECAIRETNEETGIAVKVISSLSIAINANSAKSLPQPLIIMEEDVPYEDAHHEHFDVIYLGIAGNTKLTKNEESLDCRWFDKNDIHNIETYENVKEIIKYGFDTFAIINKRTERTGKNVKMK